MLDGQAHKGEYAMTDIETVLRRFEGDLDKATATLVVTDDPEKRHLIGEALLVGAALFLVQKYCAAFLEGVGLHDAAKAHGRKARQFLARVRSGSLRDQDVDQEKKDVGQALQEISDCEPANGPASGERAVHRLLRESGATTQQAERISKSVTRALTEAERS